MKVTLYLASFVFLGGFLSSCYSNRMLVDDDVYVMKNAALPVGESLTDETNYATFKYKQDRGVTASSYYYDPYNLSAMNNCDCNPFYFTPFDCGWGSRNFGYSGLFDMYYGYGYYNAFGHYYNPYMHFGENQYGYYGNMYSPYYNPYGGYYFSNNYNTPFFYSNSAFYGSNSSYFNSGNNFNNGSNGAIYTSHSGPRGSLSGISNAGNRTNIYTLKSHSANASSDGTNGIKAKPLIDRSTVGDQLSAQGRADIKAVPSNNRLVPSTDLRPTQTRPIYTSTEARNGSAIGRTSGFNGNSNGTSLQQRNTEQPINRGSSGGSIGGATRGGGSSNPSPGVRRN